MASKQEVEYWFLTGFNYLKEIIKDGSPEEKDEAWRTWQKLKDELYKGNGRILSLTKATRFESRINNLEKKLCRVYPIERKS